MVSFGLVRFFEETCYWGSSRPHPGAPFTNMTCLGQTATRLIWAKPTTWLSRYRKLGYIWRNYDLTAGRCLLLSRVVHLPPWDSNICWLPCLEFPSPTGRTGSVSSLSYLWLCCHLLSEASQPSFLTSGSPASPLWFTVSMTYSFWLTEHFLLCFILSPCAKIPVSHKYDLMF